MRTKPVEKRIYTREDFQRWGAEGGRKVSEARGPEWMRKIVKKRWKQARDLSTGK